MNAPDPSRIDDGRRAGTVSTLDHDDAQRLRRAQRRAGAKLGWMIHATVFVAVNLLLAGVWMFSSRSGAGYWPGFPLVGWGLGLAIHGAAVWLSMTDLRDRMVERELRRLDRR